MDKHVISRRTALKQGLAGAAGLALMGHAPNVAQAATPAPRAKSVIQIWMWGGPAHLDTFDPKPEAGRDYCGPLDKPIKTNVDGIRIGQLLPKLAQQADKFSIIRSMTHGINGHETASYIMQTGRQPGRLVFPGVGAVVSSFKGYDHGYDGLVPPYILLTTPQGRFSEAGFLGQQYKPFATGGDPNANPFAVEGIVSKSINDKRQHSRRDLLQGLDTFGQAIPGHAAIQEFNTSEAKAYDMMFGEARQLFDLGEEPKEIREAYGRNRFGQSCLMARRLVEHGVPYITINYKGWDTHKQHFEFLNRNMPDLDQGLAMLLLDLERKGLLDSTIVWWGGEFGRGPKVQWNAPWNGGRSHFGQCFSVMLAGGGFKGGQVVGASNAKGMEVKDRPVYPQDLIGSIYDRLGIDPKGKLPNPKGLDVTVLPTGGEEMQTAGRLKEIMV